jgi:uncharacterized Zn finger protein
MTVIKGPWGDSPVVQDARHEAWNGRFPPPSRPRKAVGGIKARSKRGTIGEQWWSRRFIDVLESLGMQSRLTRGRNYARSGQVLNLAIGTGHVSAQVQGSRVKPYKVVLTVVPLTKPQWRAVEGALAARAVFRARLLAGEMPAEIEDVFADCGTPLFPRTARDLMMSCSCPDWQLPCKHVAAVCYVLAEAFDDDPFAMLAWRGKGRDALLAALRGQTLSEAGRGKAGLGRASLDDARVGGAGLGAGGRHGAGLDGAELGGADLGGAGLGGAGLGGAGRPRAQGSVPDPGSRPLADCVSGFWSSGLSPARLRALPRVAPAPADLVLRGFEPPPILIQGHDLATVLRPAYELMARDPAAAD